MHTEMFLKHMSHESIDGTPNGGDLLQDSRAFVLGLQGLFQARDLSFYASDALEKFGFSCDCVRHPALRAWEYSTILGYSILHHQKPAGRRGLGRHTHCNQASAFGDGNPLAERNTRRAVWLTLFTMVAEIGGGLAFNSMALLADGWHMGSHALALGLSTLAFAAARRFAFDGRFTFGTWKIEILGGYTSALLLAVIAAAMAWQSVARLLAPMAIRYDQAIALAVAGLVVNLVCARLLRDHHDHGPAASEHQHHHHPGGERGLSRDLNLRAAYVHVLADAATSVLAVLALIGGKLWGANWLDPVIGLAGTALVALWAWRLLRDTARVLLDAEMDAPVVAEIREVIDQLPFYAELADLHVWRVATDRYACVLSVLTDHIPADADFFREQLSVHEEIAHVTVEVIPRSRGDLVPAATG